MMGDITQREYNDIFLAAQAYFKAAISYILKKFPLTDELLKHAKWIDIQNRSDAEWQSVEFFLLKFNSVLNVDTNTKMNTLFDEFCDFQTLGDNDVGEKAWSEAKVIDGQWMGKRYSFTGWMCCGGTYLICVFLVAPKSASITFQRWQSLFLFCLTAMQGKSGYSAWSERIRQTAGLH